MYQPEAYGMAFLFMFANMLCWFAKKPLTGTPAANISDYFQAKPPWHWGVLGGFVWCTGLILNFVAAHAQMVGVAVSCAIGQGGTMVSAVRGVFIWKEFASAPWASRELIPAMFVCFLLGQGSIASAPMLAK
jgi:glucose uptake protein